MTLGPLVPCAGCRATIRFVETTAHWRLPVEPAAITLWLREGGGPTKTLIDRNGRVHRGTLADAETPTAWKVEGFLPHWLACPARRDFKRRPSAHGRHP